MNLRAVNAPRLEDRIGEIKKLFWGDVRDRTIGPRLRELSLNITRECRGRDDMCELKAIYDFTVNNIRYTGDFWGKDTFQSPFRTLQFRGGDCDDHAALNAMLASWNGFKTKWRVTSNTGATWDHIYALAGVPRMDPTRWVPLDTTLPIRAGSHKFNVHPPHRKYREFSVE